MKITKVLNIDKNSIVSIVGAGGKTSLMFQLGEELKDKGRVLVTTTTKIYLPKQEQYHCLIVEDSLHGNTTEGCLSVDSSCEDEVMEMELTADNTSFHEEVGLKKTGIWVYGQSITDDGKLTAVNEDKLKERMKFFDYVLIEADGAKSKALKGWREDEPVISSHTTCTIGVLSGQVLGMDIKEDNIHRVNKFLGKAKGIVAAEDLIEVIFNSKGMFNHSRGKAVLFINQVDDEIICRAASGLISEIINKNCKYGLLNQVIVGSLKERNYLDIALGGQDG